MSRAALSSVPAVAKHRTYSERLLRAEAKRFLRLFRKEMIQLVLLIGAVCVVETVLSTPRYFAGLTVGFFVTAMVAIIGFAFLLNGDGAFLIAGWLGESHTVEELEAAKKAGLIWSGVNNVEVSGRDVDHIVLTPAGVLSVESKWRFKGADRRYLAWATGKAADAARQAKLILQSKGIDYRTDVRPVLVIWGGARRELPMVQVVNDVTVVRGDHLQEWLKASSRGRLAQDHAEALQAKLEVFAKAHSVR